MALPLVDRIRADLDVRVALVHSGLGDGERADEWRRIRAGDVDVVVGTRLAVLRRWRRSAWSSWTRNTTRPTRATGRRASGPRRGDPRWPRLAGAACVLGSATPAVDTEGHARSGRYRRVELRDRAPGAPPSCGSWTCARNWPPASGGCCPVRWRRPSPRSTRRPASRPSSSSTGGARHRSCCAATAATSRPAPTASDRSSTTRPGPRSAATTAAAPRRSRPAVRPAARRGSATWAVARSASSARSATGSRACASVGSIVTSSSARARRSASSMPSSTAAGRPRRHEPGRQGPGRPERHPRRRRLVRCRPEPAGRTGRGTDLPAARAGGRPGRPRRPARPGVPADVPARAPGHRGRPDRRCPGRSTTPSSIFAAGSGRRRSADWSS